MATLVPCLVALRSEFDELAPQRDHESDGWIGDAAHQQEPSDHNPDGRGLVHAIDVDADLRQPGWTMERAVQLTVARHRLGDDNRLSYVIYNRRIWAASWGWTERAYTGTNPHDKHAHFSARYLPALEDNEDDWGLWEAELAEITLSDATITKIAEKVAERLKIGDKGVMDKLGADLMNDKSGVAIGTRRQIAAVLDERDAGS